MKALAYFLLFGWVTGGQAFVFATDSNSALRPIDYSYPSGHVADGSFCFFAGQPIKFDAEVNAPVGTHLAIYGDLYQTAGDGWAAPVLKKHAMCPALYFEKCTESLAVCTLPSLPLIREPAGMLLKLYAGIQGQPDSLRPMAAIVLYIYPRESAAEWKKEFAALLECRGLSGLAVFGRGMELRAFFHRQQIAFDDLGADWPMKWDLKIMYLGGYPTAKPDGLVLPQGLHAAFFQPPARPLPVLPGVYSTCDCAGGCVVNVTLQGVIEQLDEDPLSQEGFIAIMQQAAGLQGLQGGSSLSRWPTY